MLRAKYGRRKEPSLSTKYSKALLTILYTNTVQGSLSPLLGVGACVFLTL